jgi:sugar O-acyltransferase (sialic acid O-acetyltransferase NeuD family)
MTNVTKLLILGAGGFAVDVFEAVELSGVYEPVGFVVSDPDLLTRPRHCGLPVVDFARVPWSPTDVQCIAAIVSPARERFILQAQARGFTFATVVHPTAIVSRSAAIGPGCFVGAGAILGAHVRLHEHVIVNRGANIGHDADIRPFVTIGPGAIMAGRVSAGAGTCIGVGAVIRDRIAIGRGSVVGAGAVVVKPVGDHVLVAGCPARVVRRLQPGVSVELPASARVV